MIVYNLSIKIDSAIEKEWVRWQMQEHIPDVMGSGQFSDYRFYRLLDHDEEEDKTYIVQYFTPDIESYRYYIDNIAPILRQKALDKWGDRFTAFRSVMEAVN